MSKLTETEKRIVLMLVKLNSKDKLIDVLGEWEGDGLVGEIQIVRDCYKLLSLSGIEQIDGQYLNYAINNYESIKRKDFSSPIERMVSYDYEVDGVETETVSVRYTVNFNTLPSLLNQKIQDIKEYFWDYDPDRETYDYLESDVDSLDFDDAEVQINDYITAKNVIE